MSHERGSSATDGARRSGLIRGHMRIFCAPPDVPLRAGEGKAAEA